MSNEYTTSLIDNVQASSSSGQATANRSELAGNPINSVKAQRNWFEFLIASIAKSGSSQIPAEGKLQSEVEESSSAQNLPHYQSLEYLLEVPAEIEVSKSESPISVSSVEDPAPEIDTVAESSTPAQEAETVPSPPPQGPASEVDIVTEDSVPTQELATVSPPPDPETRASSIDDPVRRVDIAVEDCVLAQEPTLATPAFQEESALEANIVIEDSLIADMIQQPITAPPPSRQEPVSGIDMIAEHSTFDSTPTDAIQEPTTISPPSQTETTPAEALHEQTMDVNLDSTAEGIEPNMLLQGQTLPEVVDVPLNVIPTPDLDRNINSDTPRPAASVSPPASLIANPIKKMPAVGVPNPPTPKKPSGRKKLVGKFRRLVVRKPLLEALLGKDVGGVAHARFATEQMLANTASTQTGV